MTAAIVTAWETRINQAAADGKISQERATNLKDRLAEKANRLVERTFPQQGTREGNRGSGKHGNRGWDHKNNGTTPASSTAAPA